MSAERLAKLAELGLSAYASRAYLALLQLGTTEAREVSRLARVPVAKVYGTLDHLQEKGLVEVLPGQPKRYAPVPIADYLRKLQDAHRESIRGLEAAEPTLSRMFEIRGDADMGDRGGVVALRGRRNVVEKFRTLARDAERTVTMLLSDGGVRRLAHLRDVLTDARGRGVEVRALARVDAATVGAVAELAAVAEVRAKPDMPPGADRVGIAVFDGRCAMLIHFVPDDASLHNGKDHAVVVDEEALVRALGALVEREWDAAPPYGERRLVLEHAGAGAGSADEALPSVGLWEMDLRTGAVVCTPETYRLLGASPGEADLAAGWLDRVHPDDREKLAAVERLVLQHHVGTTVAFRVVLPDGRVRHLESRSQVARDAQGQACKVVGATTLVAADAKPGDDRLPAQ